jgi:hydroxymethylglutaryl-CoA synthase
VTTFGIDRIGLYSPRFCINALELAAARGRDRETARERLMLGFRAVAPPYEDAVTLAVNAAKLIMTPDEAAEVELLIVGTESAVDFGKPVSSWVHRYCGLCANGRNFEIKHACYGATAALRMAIGYLASQGRENAKALVIATDLTRPFPQDGYDFAGGAMGLAMLVTANPRVLEIHPRRCGYWADEVADTFRPTATAEIGDNQTSLFSYLDALDGAYDDYCARCEKFDYDSDFTAHIYHAPFPGMTLEAHRTLLRRNPAVGAEEIRVNFERKVKPALHYAQLVGAAYGGSNFVCLLGALRNHEGLSAESRISFFAYGSGCQGEFYDGAIGPDAQTAARLDVTDGQLASRKELSVESYDAIQDARLRAIDKPYFRPLSAEFTEDFERMYAGQQLLVLDEIVDFRRRYAWS